MSNKDILQNDEFRNSLWTVCKDMGIVDRFLSRMASYFSINPDFAEIANSAKNAAKFASLCKTLVCLDLDLRDEVQMRYFKNKQKEGEVNFSYSLTVDGYCKLAHRVPGFTLYRPVLVRNSDEFEQYTKFEDSYTKVMRHVPDLNADGVITADDLKCGYIGWKIGGEYDMAIITRAEILDARDRSPNWKNAVKYDNKKNAVWENSFAGMALKTVVRRAAKYWPLEMRNYIPESDLIDGDPVDIEEPAAVAESPTKAASASSSPGKKGRGRPPKKKEEPPAPTEEETGDGNWEPTTPSGDEALQPGELPNDSSAPDEEDF